MPKYQTDSSANQPYHFPLVESKGSQRGQVGVMEFQWDVLVPSLPAWAKGQVSLTEVIPEGAESWLPADCSISSWTSKSIREEEPEWHITGFITGERKRQIENKSL